MVKLIINTEYPELVRFLFSGLRREISVPYRDNFFLVKNLTHNEHRALNGKNNYVIISKSFASEEWGRDEIFEYCKAQLKSRRKPTYVTMTDREFEKNIKIFLVTGKWVTEDIESAIFSLYKNLDSKSARWEVFYNMLAQGVHPMAIFYSLLTFVTKVYDIENISVNISKWYVSVLRGKSRRVKQNFKKALERYSLFGKEVDDEFKVVRFLMDLGGGYESI